MGLKIKLTAKRRSKAEREADAQGPFARWYALHPSTRGAIGTAAVGSVVALVVGLCKK